MQRQHGQRQRREEAGRAAVGDPADPVHDVHAGDAEGRREQPPQEVVRVRVDDEGARRQRAALARQPEQRRGDKIERSQQVEEERRVEKELRVDVPLRDRECLGHDDVLVDVDEAVREPPSDPVQAHHERQEEDRREQARGDGRAVPTQPRGRRLHASRACSSTVAPSLAISRKQLTSPV